MIFIKKGHRKQKQNRSIIWLSPPFSRNVTTSIAKRFFNILDLHFPKTNKFHNLFNRNSVKVSYCFTEYLSSILKTRNKKVTHENIKPKDQCSCRNNNDYTLDVTAKQLILFTNTLSQPVLIQEVYLGTAEGNFTKRYYNQKT